MKKESELLTNLSKIMPDFDIDMTSYPQKDYQWCEMEYVLNIRAIKKNIKPRKSVYLQLASADVDVNDIKASILNSFKKGE